MAVYEVIMKHLNKEKYEKAGKRNKKTWIQTTLEF